MRSTLFTVRLRMTTPGGVSAPEEQDWEVTGDDTGTRVRNILPLRRDPAGHEHIPGTTIAGSLRAHCRDATELTEMFGPEPGEHRAASPIQVMGTILAPAQPIKHTRTAVDRHRGAPRGTTLRTIELLPAGTEFTVMLRWNDAPPAGLAALRNRVRVWAPTIGRGASIGAGRCVVTGIGEQTYDLSTEDGLVAWLAIRGPDDYPPVEPVDPPRPKGPLRTVTLRVVDALHIGSGETKPGAQKQEVAQIVSRGRDVVIPGSGLKGVLRSRAEYICRALGVDACDNAVCGNCRPCRIFGHGAANRGDPMRRAAIAIPDAIVRHPVVEERQHVTIDRFTGGAVHELLFTHKVLVAGRFDLIIEPLGDPLGAADLALLDAVLLDLDDGLIGIGARTTAGYGTVAIVGDWNRPDLTRLPGALTAVTS